MPSLKIVSQGKEFICLFDKKDERLISRYHWSLQNGYASTKIGKKSIFMHRLILGVVDKPQIQVDHRYHNKLDNRRAMIRTCTRSENRRNSRKIKIGSSSLKGIYKDGRLWHAQIFNGEKVLNLGRYRCEITAGIAYDNSAKEIFKDFAFLNFPEVEAVKQMEIPGFK